MALKVMIASLLVGVCLASEAAKGEEEGRLLFLTGLGTTDNNTSITVSSDIIYLLGFLLLGLIAAAIIATAIGVGVGVGKDTTGYAPTGYTGFSAPAYAEESSYAVHRSLDEAQAKYQ